MVGAGGVVDAVFTVVSIASGFAGSTIRCLPCVRFGSIGLRQGLPIGSGRATICTAVSPV